MNKKKSNFSIKMNTVWEKIVGGVIALFDITEGLQ